MTLSDLVTRPMTDADYFAAPGLSASGMKDLMVSPLRYWHLHVRPDREPVEPTRAQEFGTALHCAVLGSTEEFAKRYARAIDPADYPGLLVTIEDIRKWCADKGSPAKGTRKDAIIEHALYLDSRVPILQVIEQQHGAANHGKTLLGIAEWDLLAGASTALRNEPRVQEILAKGQAEVPYFVVDPKTGIVLKSKMDWVAPTLIADVKTFTTQTRGKSIDKSVTDAIFWEGYYRQAYFYSMVRALAEGSTWDVQNYDFVFLFVESEPPHEVRLKVLRPKFAGNPNVFWLRAMGEVNACIDTYERCMRRFGTDIPWRRPQKMRALLDDELPAEVNNSSRTIDDDEDEDEPRPMFRSLEGSY